MRPGSPNACSAHALPACADFSVCRLLCSILFTPAALCLRSLNFPPAGFLHRESSQGSSVSASNSSFNRRAMAWSASSGSTRPLREDRNNIIGLVTSGRTAICPGIPKGGIKKRSHHFIVKGECEEDDLSDGPCNAAEKKRRLTADQVKFLEMSFSMDLKLEPERKALLAKKLGIRPRQVAIWFQNRRARWKNKQLEQDFENLKASFDAVMTEKENILLERESVLEENKRLQEEVMRLQGLLERTRNVGPSDTAGTGSEGKSGLTSLNKSSEDQGEVQDSGQSCPLPGETEGMEAMAPTVWDLNPGLMCSVSVKAECDHAPIFPIDEFFGPSNCTLLFHPSTISGVYFEDGFYSNYYDGHLTGLACHEYIEP